MKPTYLNPPSRLEQWQRVERQARRDCWIIGLVAAAIVAITIWLIWSHL